MSAGSWRVGLTSAAAHDLDALLGTTLMQFGDDQVLRYHALINASLRELRAGPGHPLARRLDGGPDDIWTLHIRRRGHPARHLLAYRAAGAKTIEVLRILHDAMDLPRHLGLQEDADPFEYGL